jgi:type IV secretion system protein VirB10
MSSANVHPNGRKRPAEKDGTRGHNANTPGSPTSADGNVARDPHEAPNNGPTTSVPATSFKTDIAPENPEVRDDEENLIPAVSAPRRQPLATKGLIAVFLLASTLVGFSVLTIHRFAAGLSKSGAEDFAPSRDRPAAASAEPRRLDLEVGTVPRVNAAASSALPSGQQDAPSHRVPALVPTSEEMADPIGVRRTGAAPPTGSAARSMLPEDAPIMLVSTKPIQGAPPGGLPRALTPSSVTQGGAQGGDRNGERSSDSRSESHDDPLNPMQAAERNLEIYQRRLQGLLDRLTQAGDLASQQHMATDMAGREATSPAAPMAAAQSLTELPPPTGARPGGHEQNTQGPSTQGPSHRDLGAQGQNGSMSGRQLLGGQSLGAQSPKSATPKTMATMLSHRSLVLPKGTTFSCALKSRMVTASSGMVGCMVQRHVYGDDGRVLLIERGSHLDGEYRVTAVRPGTVRIPVLWTRVRTPHGVVVDIDSPATGPLGESGIDGHVDNRWAERIGAAMLLSLIDDSVKLIASNQSEQSQGGTVVLSSTTSGTSRLAEKVLDSTINIPPLIYQNQGGIVGIHVARDVDFSSVYALVPSPAGPAGP